MKKPRRIPKVKARSISRDAAHLSVFQKRKGERARSYEEFLTELTLGSR